MVRIKRSNALGVAFGVSAFGIAAALRMVVGLAPGEYPFITFLGAVIVTAGVAGTRPAAICTVLSAVVASYYFVSPTHSFPVHRSALLGSVLFVAISALVIYAMDRLSRAADKLRAEQQVSLALAEQQRTMFAELQHRVANNFAFLSALLHLQKKEVLANPTAAADLLDEAMRRLDVMGRLHRRLHDPAALDQPLADYLRGLCDEVLDVTGAKHIRCMIEAEDVRLDLTKLTALSLLVSELITNSVKHAFKGRGVGTITVRLNRLPSDMVNVEIGDDGPGIPAGFSPEESQGLGLKIINGLASQLGAELQLPTAGMSATKLVFAA